MNLLHRFFAALAFGFCIAGVPPVVNALDISETVMLERFTILDNGSIEYAFGNLLRNGRFRVVSVDTSGILDLIGITAIDIEPISGRPVMYEILFDGYKAAGAIPRWARSQDAFYIGLNADYVIVATGRQDPNPTPICYEHPESQKVLLGDAAYFSVDAGPFSYLSYQWRHKNKPLPGEDAYWLIVDNVGLANVGTYTVELNTGGKSVLSKRATLKIAYPVIIKKEPRTQTIKQGRSATFRVSAQGTKPLTYQWYFNGNPISDATKVALIVGNIQAADAGSYTVTVRNEWSFDVSTNAVLAVTP